MMEMNSVGTNWDGDELCGTGGDGVCAMYSSAHHRQCSSTVLTATPLVNEKYQIVTTGGYNCTKMYLSFCEVAAEYLTKTEYYLYLEAFLTDIIFQMNCCPGSSQRNEMVGPTSFHNTVKKPLDGCAVLAFS